MRANKTRLHILVKIFFKIRRIHLVEIYISRSSKQKGFKCFKKKFNTKLKWKIVHDDKTFFTFCSNSEWDTIC